MKNVHWNVNSLQTKIILERSYSFELCAKEIVQKLHNRILIIIKKNHKNNLYLNLTRKLSKKNYALFKLMKTLQLNSDNIVFFVQI